MKIRKHIIIKCVRCGVETQMRSNNQKRCPSCSLEIKKIENRKNRLQLRDPIVENRKEPRSQCAECGGTIEHKSSWRRFCDACRQTLEKLSNKLSAAKVKDRTAIRENARKRVLRTSRRRSFACEFCGKVLPKIRNQKYCNDCFNLSRARRTRERALRKMQVPGTHTRAQFYRLCESLGWQCTYCGAALNMRTATEDHMVPVSRGGADDISNITPSCLRCNVRKGIRAKDEFVSFRMVRT